MASVYGKGLCHLATGQFDQKNGEYTVKTGNKMFVDALLFTGSTREPLKPLRLPVTLQATNRPDKVAQGLRAFGNGWKASRMVDTLSISAEQMPIFRLNIHGSEPHQRLAVATNAIAIFITL
ncbi:hypothetical protein [Kosakonia pseudosacchari]|uniref:hypothetical protein n=1 Tax=Kosakonia pseudosacchari TaxID=1646340 RepID=UPI0018802FE6|nr:hypothetical protein [Kosakonia pseudosacchari]QOV66033.1 hypothetical protein IP581_10480 [Kosakonia pseudosacchari]